MKSCPACGAAVEVYDNPFPTVDVVVFEPGLGVVLVERRNPPPGWALPGGFVDQGETCERAAVREALEETGLEVVLTGLLGVYSDPARDPRMHTISVVYIAQAVDPKALRAGDDAAGARFFGLDRLPDLAFDHGRIVADFRRRIEVLNAPSEAG
ncbi:MAG: NUDIX hydrolase [Desulfovibrionaceae bacterium]|nr:NUDIX hydrolase [Desulfovibrionaceae bacterium]